MTATVRVFRQTKSGREVVVFLFNDFVLLTNPSRPLGTVSQLEFDRNLSNLKFKLYKKVRDSVTRTTPSNTEKRICHDCEPTYNVSLSVSPDLRC